MTSQACHTVVALFSVLEYIMLMYVSDLWVNVRSYTGDVA